MTDQDILLPQVNGQLLNKKPDDIMIIENTKLFTHFKKKKLFKYRCLEIFLNIKIFIKKWIRLS